MNDEDLIGYYDMRQLSSANETNSQKKRVGIFPWSPSTIQRKIKRQEFPKPLKFGEATNTKRQWRKEDIHQLLKKMEMEAVSR